VRERLGLTRDGVPAIWSPLRPDRSQTARAVRQQGTRAIYIGHDISVTSAAAPCGAPSGGRLADDDSAERIVPAVGARREGSELPRRPANRPRPFLMRDRMHRRVVKPVADQGDEGEHISRGSP